MNKNSMSSPPLEFEIHSSQCPNHHLPLRRCHSGSGNRTTTTSTNSSSSVSFSMEKAKNNKNKNKNKNSSNGNQQQQQQQQEDSNQHSSSTLFTKLTTTTSGTDSFASIHHRDNMPSNITGTSSFKEQEETVVTINFDESWRDEITLYLSKSDVQKQQQQQQQQHSETDHEKQELLLSQNKSVVVRSSSCHRSSHHDVVFQEWKERVQRLPCTTSLSLLLMTREKKQQQAVVTATTTTTTTTSSSTGNSNSSSGSSTSCPCIGSSSNKQSPTKEMYIPALLQSPSTTTKTSVSAEQRRTSRIGRDILNHSTREQRSSNAAVYNPYNNNKETTTVQVHDYKLEHDQPRQVRYGLYELTRNNTKFYNKKKCCHLHTISTPKNCYKKDEKDEEPNENESHNNNNNNNPFYVDEETANHIEQLMYTKTNHSFSNHDRHDTSVSPTVTTNEIKKENNENQMENNDDHKKDDKNHNKHNHQQHKELDISHHNPDEVVSLFPLTFVLARHTYDHDGTTMIIDDDDDCSSMGFLSVNMLSRRIQADEAILHHSQNCSIEKDQQETPLQQLVKTCDQQQENQDTAMSVNNNNNNDYNMDHNMMKDNNKIDNEDGEEDRFIRIRRFHPSGYCYYSKAKYLTDFPPSVRIEL